MDHLLWLSERTIDLAAARVVASAHHALVELLLGADDAITAGVDAPPLNAD